MRNLIDYQGILFDPATGETWFRATENAQLAQTPYTFELATWTAAAIFRACGQTLAKHAQETSRPLTALLNDDVKVVGPFTRTPERTIDVYYGPEMLLSSAAGRIASSIIRRGHPEAMRDWLAEVKLAFEAVRYPRFS